MLGRSSEELAFDCSFSLLHMRTRRRVSVAIGARLRRLDPERLERLSPAVVDAVEGPRSETLRVKFPSGRRPMLSFEDADDTAKRRKIGNLFSNIPLKEPTHISIAADGDA